MPDDIHNPPGASGPLPYPDEVLMTSSKRMVVPRPVFRRRRMKALYARCVSFTRLWSVGRLTVGLFCIFAFGLIGLSIADGIFCTAETGVRFWEGCLYETIGFGAGGGLLGLIFALLAVRAFDHRPSSKLNPAINSDNPGKSVT